MKMFLFVLDFNKTSSNADYSQNAINHLFTTKKIMLLTHGRILNLVQKKRLTRTVAFLFAKSQVNTYGFWLLTFFSHTDKGFCSIFQLSEIALFYLN